MTEKVVYSEETDSESHSDIHTDTDSDYEAEIKEEPLSAVEEDDDGDSVSGGSNLESGVKSEISDAASGNLGMADVMAKILRKSVTGPVIMSKALTEKQLATRKRKHLQEKSPGDDVVVVKSEGSEDIKTEPNDSIPLETDPKRRKRRSNVEEKAKKERDELCHVQPNALDRNKEMNLIKIATRGVVQLFNAVKQQQGKIKSKLKDAGSSIRKADKAIASFSSGDFLDRLKTQKVTTVSAVANSDMPEVKDEVKEEPSWDVLRDDFMTTSQTMKDWDKGLDDNGSVEET